MTIQGTESAFHREVLRTGPIPKLGNWDQVTHERNSYTSYLEVAADIAWKAGNYLDWIAYAFSAKVSSFYDSWYSADRNIQPSVARNTVQTAFKSLMVMYKIKPYFNQENLRFRGPKNQEDALEWVNASRAYKQAVTTLRRLVREGDEDAAREIIEAIRDQVLFLPGVDELEFRVDGQGGSVKLTSYLLTGVPKQEDHDWLLLSQRGVVQRGAGRDPLEEQRSRDVLESQRGVKRATSEHAGIFSSVEEITDLFDLAYPHRADIDEELAFSEDSDDEDDFRFAVTPLASPAGQERHLEVTLPLRSGSVSPRSDEDFGGTLVYEPNPFSPHARLDRALATPLHLGGVAEEEPLDEEDLLDFDEVDLTQGWLGLGRASSPHGSEDWI